LPVKGVQPTTGSPGPRRILRSPGALPRTRARMTTAPARPTAPNGTCAPWRPPGRPAAPAPPHAGAGRAQAGDG